MFRIINLHYDNWLKLELRPSFTDSDFDLLLKLYQEDIEELCKAVFQKLFPIIQSQNQGEFYKKIQYISLSYFLKINPNLSPANDSGVVITGFGEDEIFPSYIAYKIWGKVHDTILYSEHSHGGVNLQSQSAGIIPFAQDDMVKSFIEGIEPNFQNLIFSTLDELFKKYPEYIVEIMTNLSDSDKKIMIQVLSEKSNLIFSDFLQKMMDYKKSVNIAPILQVVTNLPKDELAAMAEALLNLTSFKRRVSMSAETVGGPIDVAVISKGDGFIWIKRKFYFDPKLNARYIAHYYQEND